ncbi:MAG TPA: hypothetical protein VNK04_21840, partial [Gemmataceae bacterium]|nr:hypothetical protein [Gemmataceae bacterium]
MANWQAGNAYYRLSEEQRRQAPAELVQAVEALRHIGASGPCYPSPRMPPEELEAGKEDAAGAWPLQVRSLVQALATLPPESRKPIGRLLAGDGDLGQVLRNLDAMDDHHLDAFVRGLVRINLHQSTKGVLAAVEEIVKSQQQLNIPAVRQRFDVLEDQLRVWDLREGWTGEGYDANAEKRMRDIAQTLDIPLSTVQGRYEAAFQQLFGYPYTPERWAAWVLPIKADIGKWAGWRRSKSRREG